MAVSAPRFRGASVAAPAALAVLAAAGMAGFAHAGGPGSGGGSGPGCGAACGKGPAVVVPGPVIGGPSVSVGVPGTTLPVTNFGTGHPVGTSPGAGCGSACGSKGPSVFVPGIKVGGPVVNVVGPQLDVNINNVVVNQVQQTQFAGQDQQTVFAPAGSFYAPVPGPGTVIDDLSIGEETYLETITEQVPVQEQTCVDEVVERRVLQTLTAVCLDDGGTPHPASRLSPEDAIPAGYSGELYRCMAGTRMQVTLAADGQGGQSFACHKGEALVFNRTGKLSCAPQAERRDCFERSLLRRFGPGVKHLQAVSRQTVCKPVTHTVMKTVERQVERTRPAAGAPLILGGGVGNGVY